MPDSAVSPTIAVVIAAKNASRYVGEALDSLAAQSHLPDEIIVIDDGSDDETTTVLEGYLRSLPMLRLLRNRDSAGISRARNLANAEVESDYIAVLDADDFFEEHAIGKYIAFIRKNTDVDLIYADAFVFSESKETAIRRNYPEFKTSRVAIRKTLGTPLLPFKHSSMVYRTASVRELKGYDESLQIKVDIELFLRFQSRNKSVLKLDYATSYHRKHKGQISRNRIKGLSVFADLLKTYEPDPFVRYLLLSKRIPSELAKLLIRG